MLRNERTILRQHGFNLMELMVVLFVGSLLMSIGVPAFNDFMDNSRMAAAANDVSTSLHVARTEAVKRRAVVSICPSTNWNAAVPTCQATASMEDGWVVFVDAVPPTAANLAPENADAVLYSHGPMNGAVDVAPGSRTAAIAGRTYVMYQPTGFPVPTFGALPSTFNFQLCDGRGDKNTGGGIAAGRWIQVTPTGRPQVHRTQTAVESAANPTGGCS